MQIEIGTVVVSGVIQTGIGVMFWFAIQRTVEKVDKLTEQVADLKDRRVTAMEAAHKEHAEKDASARKGLYERVATIERTYVEGTACRVMMAEIKDGMTEYRAAVLDLAKVQADVQHAARFVAEVNERVIGVVTDVARIQGEMKP